MCQNGGKVTKQLSFSSQRFLYDIFCLVDIVEYTMKYSKSVHFADFSQNVQDNEGKISYQDYPHNSAWSSHRILHFTEVDKYNTFINIQVLHSQLTLYCAFFEGKIKIICRSHSWQPAPSVKKQGKLDFLMPPVV